ncbi:MAG TPA: FAD-linked oxidase C-terminal domain-containing protein [Pyrinomonadaceae bacterium]|nr:FAD-linked oxidase C-terminal domain-containing protein [Pyrinomonadaceae bacterium]
MRRRIRGEVRFDDGSRALYATDASNYRQVPIGVVIPRDKEDVLETIAAAHRAGAPVLARGGGTSLAGQCCNVAVVLDFSKHLNRVIEMDPNKNRARVEPGCILDTLRSQAEEHRLTFAPDPSTHNHCTLGGMIGNNSCGVHSLMGGKTDDNIEELEILTYDGFRMRVGATGEAELARIIREGGRRGEIYSRLKTLRDRYADLIRQHFPDIPRCVSGYNLTWLLPEKGFHVARALVGSESTCVMVLEATTRLVHSPPGRALLVLGYRDVYNAADHVVDVLDHKPIGLEGIDDKLIDDMKRLKLHPDNIAVLPDGKGWLLVEFGGDTEDESKQKAQALMEQLKTKHDAPSMKLFTEKWEERMIWKVRESGLGATAHVPDRPVTWEGWEDSAVPPERLGHYLRELRKLMDQYEYTGDFYGHFGQGCLHTRINFDLETRAGIDKFRSFLERAAELVLSHGGSLSGEHGDGQARGWLLERMFGPELIKAFREFKSIWDPEAKMNPGKIVDSYRVDENLRIGTDYHPVPVETHFRWPKDGGDFARVALRCVGVGECRRYEGGTMCPSFRVTGEEMHSTRGRARLLWEMLQGDVIRDGWKSEAVKEALDLCLACKGCKSDCPVSVDMATYKAEFLSHYYERRLRPLHAYAFGYIDAAARLASIAPRFVNLFTHTAPFARLAKWVVGMPQQRRIPAFAPRTFKHWFKQRQSAIRNRQSAMQQVVLWADTFNNYFLPRTAQAAVEVLEAAGFQVIVPSQPLCCGRPLYDFGLLPRATRLLKQTIAALRPIIAAGVPVVGLEPSCVAVFRDEMTNLLPDDQDARRLSQQTYLLTEFLEAKTDFAHLPKLQRRAIVHDHCHKKAVIKKDDEWKLLKQLGLDFEVLDSGCCGMAGSFGFVKEHYELSLKIGELVLLPAVREAPEDTLIIADGFSCREQIAQTTKRRALHSAEVIQMAINSATNDLKDQT